METGRTSTSHRGERSSLRTPSEFSAEDFRVHGGTGGIVMFVLREGGSASVFISAIITFLEGDDFVLPSDVPTPSRGASREVLQRLTEEQRVELKDLGEENETHQCSICIEDMSKSSRENIIKMPRCSHMFHEKCLFEWLRRENSCPLCRSVPYE